MTSTVKMYRVLSFHNSIVLKLKILVSWTHQAHTHTVIIVYQPLVTIGSKIYICPWVCLSAITAPYTEMGLRVCLCVQQSFVVTLELQSVVSEREEVSSTNQKCPSAVLHLSFWSAQRPDFVKVMVPGVAHSHAVSVSLIIYVHLMSRENREAIIKM